MRQLLNGQDHTVGFNASILSYSKRESKTMRMDMEQPLIQDWISFLHNLHKNRKKEKRRKILCNNFFLWIKTSNYNTQNTLSEFYPVSGSSFHIVIKNLRYSMYIHESIKEFEIVYLITKYYGFDVIFIFSKHSSNLSNIWLPKIGNFIHENKWLCVFSPII